MKSFAENFVSQPALRYALGQGDAGEMPSQAQSMAIAMYLMSHDSGSVLDMWIES